MATGRLSVARACRVHAPRLRAVARAEPGLLRWVYNGDSDWFSCDAACGPGKAEQEVNFQLASRPPHMLSLRIATIRGGRTGTFYGATGTGAAPATRTVRSTRLA